MPCYALDDREMGPYIRAPHPEDAALAVIAAYSKTYGLTIMAANGVWIVTGNGLDAPVQHAMYTDLVCWLARRYGLPKVS
jgi:hypothetical protein